MITVLQILVVLPSAIIACIFFYMSIRVLILYIRHPSVFKTKERKEPPKCLTDPSNGTHGYACLKDMKIHYIEKGDRMKPLMLFVHGFPEFWYSWRYQIQEFSKDYWTVAIDMRGYGDSEKPTGMNHYTLNYLVNDIKQLVDSLGQQKFIFVGHDWGGVIAWHFIQKYPDMVESFVIMDAPFIPALMEVVKSNWRQYLCSWYIFLFMMPYLPELVLSAFDFGVFKVSFRGRRRKSKDALTVTNEDIEAFKYHFSKPNGFTPPINYYRAYIKNLVRFRSRRHRKRTLNIEIPGLYIFGEFDYYLVPEHMNVAKKYVKNLTVKVVKGANHFVQQDEPQVVNQYMREFFRSVNNLQE